MSLLSSILEPLFEFLKCLVLYLLGALLALLVGLANLVIAAVMAVVGPALGLLPTVSLGSASIPSGLSETLGWVNYFLPVAFCVSLGLVVLTVSAAWIAVRTILRWAKVA